MKLIMIPKDKLTEIRQAAKAWDKRARIEAAYQKRVAGQMWNPAKDKPFLEQGRFFGSRTIILPYKGLRKYRY